MGNAPANTADDAMLSDSQDNNSDIQALRSLAKDYRFISENMNEVDRKSVV